MSDRKSTLTWSSLFLVTFLAAALYMFMEWLFTITRLSYMTTTPFYQQVLVFTFASALMACLGFLLLLPLTILGLLPRFKKDPSPLIKLGVLVPAAICAALILILVDNFTYTLFKFGIVSTSGLSRFLYGLGFILVLILCYRGLLNLLESLSERLRNRKRAPVWIFGLLISAILLGLIAPALTSRLGGSIAQVVGDSSNGLRPNILMITSDGVNATNLSVYGYERDTTPYLKEMAKSALVAENAFSNAGPTAGSVISIYTGKYPADTRLLYPPDILKGIDAYQHLPAILSSLGYHTVQLTLPYFLDAYQLNLLDGFDEANGRTAKDSQFLAAVSQILPSDYAYFTYEAANRISDRVRHIFFLKQMTNPYDLVTSQPERFGDRQRVRRMLHEIKTADGPVFVHVHLMGTHGDTFNPPKQKFSAGQSVDTQKPWSVDFYDDSLLAFDGNIARLVEPLTRLGFLEETILIIGSDHGQKWDQVRRVPLMIRFPNGQHAGKIQTNVQNLDIAPTLLDYLGLDQPDWMRGSSLISGELDQRPIIGVSAQGQEPDETGQFEVNYDKVGPPFYQFGEITLVYCQKWYLLNLVDLSWETGPVEGSTAVCSPGSEISDQQAFEWMVAHLEENGFDVSNLDQIPPAQTDPN